MKSKAKPPADPTAFIAFCMQVLRSAFPRRKFHVSTTEDGTFIHVEGAYVIAKIMSSQSMSVSVGSHTWHSISRSRCVMVFGWAFEHETKIRKRQSHQRQQLKLYLEKLQGTEMLQNLDVQIAPFTEFYRPAEIIATFKGLPDDVIANVRFNRYREINNHTETPFTVVFGGNKFHFQEFAEVMSFLNGNFVFKESDLKVKPEQIAFLEDQIIEAGVRTIVRRAELVKLAPYLIIMEASDFEVRQVCLLTTSDSGMHYGDVPAVKALWPNKRKYEDYIACFARHELRWRFEFAKEASEEA